LTKGVHFIRGTIACLTALFEIFLEFIKEYCPDLTPNVLPWHPDDYIAYAERVNGRVAMLVLVSVLIIELASRQSIWSLVHVL
jgi:hypothetical protein